MSIQTYHLYGFYAGGSFKKRAADVFASAMGIAALGVRRFEVEPRTNFPVRTSCGGTYNKLLCFELSPPIYGIKCGKIPKPPKWATDGFWTLYGSMAGFDAWNVFVWTFEGFRSIKNKRYLYWPIYVKTYLVTSSSTCQMATWKMCV